MLEVPIRPTLSSISPITPVVIALALILRFQIFPKLCSKIDMSKNTINACFTLDVQWDEVDQVEVV